MSDEGEETLIKPYFQPTDTLQDVSRKILEEQNKNQKAGQQNSSDLISKILGYLPDWLMRVVVFTLLWLEKSDYYPGLLSRQAPGIAACF